ncbi:MAG: FAD-dependent oxidoreductase [Acidimicrobiia bacterium]|nr:FAD-dependent oxidoreductase [Acidimicrobiia bacterium]MYF25978.1 FAD-dependent oxidoreductase [Acidimicrobiia bacterium]
MREEVQVAIVGGGAMGVGLLYFLAHEGWTDTLLIEKDELTSGSTWHAAGLIPHFIGDLNVAKVHRDTADLYQKIHEETGMHAGWHGCGAVRLARSPDEVDWFYYVAGMLAAIGVEAHLLGPNEIPEVAPLLDLKPDVNLGLWTPGDGWTDPSAATNAMAVGARNLGAEISRKNRVTDMNQTEDGRWEVITQKGRIVAEHVVNAAGSYTPQLGAMVGLDVPIESVIHQYLVTEDIEEVAALEKEHPVVRDPRASCYYRQEHNGLVIGPYEREDAKEYGVEGIDWDLTFHLTPVELDRLLPWLDLAAQRLPCFAGAGIKQVVSGPITHTPDAGFLMGPAPGLRNYWYCAGASIGITQGPGAGKYLAQWMVHGQTEINVAGMDPRRFGPYAPGRYTHERSIDEFHEMYQVRMPFEYRDAGRPMKKTPLYDLFDAKGAQWQEVWGWERVMYFSPNPEVYSFRRSSAHDEVGVEVRAIRDRVGIADLTAFSKFEVTGPDASGLLDRLSANRLPARDGGIRLVHMLTSLGGIESEMTITRLGPERFYLNSAITAQWHDYDWLTSHIRDGEEVTVTDVTDRTGILAVTGPQARDVLAGLCDTDLSNRNFPWLTGQEIEVAGVPAIALRVSYVGELGWELHLPLDRMMDAYQAIRGVGDSHGMVDFGSRAMNIMRLEKAYKAHGSELTTEITPVEARLGHFVDYSKDFQGKAATLSRRDQAEPLSMVLVYAELDDGDADCLGNEPTYDGDRIMGITTSGAWAHSVGKSILFAYVDPRFEAPGSTFEVGVMNRRRTATVLEEAVWDPASERLRA